MASVSTISSSESQTLDSLLEQAFNNFVDRDCLGVRGKAEDGGPTDYTFQTYASVRSEAQLAASGLLVSGLEPRKDLVGIYSRNRPEWVVSALACNMITLTIVPLYNSSGPNCLKTTLQKTHTHTVICSSEYLKTLMEADMDTNCIRRIIQLDPVEQSHQLLAETYRIELLSWGDLLCRGRTIPVFKGIPPRPDDLYCIMWTSGDPKGVMLTQSNIVASLVNLRQLGLLPSDVHLSYLPLAHIFEHLAVLHCLVTGAAIGFWRGSVSELFDDIKALRPSVLLGVPSIFNRIHNTIVDKMQKSNALSRMMFNYGLSARQQQQQQTQSQAASPFWQRWVFQKVSSPFGGRLRILVSAAAPLSVETASFLRTALCPVVQFYGMTETAGAISFSKPDSPDGAGTTLPGTHVRLVDVPEMGYFAANKMGEICVRGPQVFQGYYEEPAKTQQVFDSDGWLHTGDIGRWNADGTLSIIDRKKNLFKLSQGEYIASEYLEGVYSRSKFVRQIFVYGDSLKHYLIAIIVPNEKYAMDWAKESGLKDINDFSQLCRHPALKRKLFDELMRASQAQRLQNFEIVKNIHLECDPWTHENGLLTPAGKLVRQQLQKKYATVISVLYEQPIMEMKRSKL